MRRHGIWALFLFMPMAVSSSAMETTQLDRAVARGLAKLRKGNAVGREKAVRELAALGPDALASLAEAHQEARTTDIEGYQSLIGAARMRLAMTHPGTAEELLSELLRPELSIRLVARDALAIAIDRPVERLIEIVRSAEAESAQEGAINALVHRREAAAIPALWSAVAEGNGDRVRWRAMRGLAILVEPGSDDFKRIESYVSDPSSSVAHLALWGMSRAGDLGIPGMIRALDAEAIRNDASAYLAMHGASAIPAMLECLETAANPEVKVLLLRALGTQRPGDERVVAALFRLASDSEPLIQAEALRSLGYQAESTEELLECLRDALDSDSYRVNVAAAEAASTQGAAVSRQLIPSLVRAWLRSEATEKASGRMVTKTDPDPESFLVALTEVGVESDLIVSAAMLLLKADSDAPHAGAILVLQSQTSLGIPLIREELRSNRNPGMAISCALALGGMGPAALPDLIALADRTEPGVWQTALRGIGLSGSNDPDVVAIIDEACEDGASRVAAFQALGWLPMEFSRLRERHLRRLADYSPQEQAALIESIARQEPDMPRFAKAVGELLHTTPSRVVRNVCIRALATGSENRKMRAAALLDALESTRSDPTQSAGFAKEFGFDESLILVALEEIAQESSTGVELVKARLRSKDAKTRILAAKALPALGANPSDVSTDLARILQDKYPMVRTAVLDALTKIGASQEILTSLGNTLSGNTPDHALFAAETLAKSGADGRVALPYLALALFADDLARPEWTRDPIDASSLATVPRSSEDLPKSRKHAPWRVTWSRDAFRDVRALAATQLGKIGATYPEDADVVRPHLVRATLDRDAKVAEAARLALLELDA